jgi:hypothetical protein
MKVLFEDGRVLFALYTTFYEELSPRLYRAFTPETQADRATVAGEAGPLFPDAQVAPVDLLLMVRVHRWDGEDGWSALYCPNRQMVIGPLGTHHVRHLQDKFRMLGGEDGMLHLREIVHLAYEEVAPEHALCGRPAHGEEAPFHTPYSWYGPEPAPQPIPTPDLYAEWNGKRVCRRCLAAAAQLKLRN